MCVQKDVTTASRKSSSNRRFSYKFNFVLDTEDAMMCCKKRQRSGGDAKLSEAKQRNNRSNLQAFQKKIIDKITPADQRSAPGGVAPAAQPHVSRV